MCMSTYSLGSKYAPKTGERDMTLRDQLGHRFGTTRNAVRSGQYQLILGAGASFGARTKRGALPDGPGLVDILAREFPDARISSDTRLPRAYQRAVQSSTSDKVWYLLKDLFSGASHEDWFTTLAGLPWKRAWTLNVDDSYEQAYLKSIRQNFASLKVIDWVDEYVEARGPEVVHLHGHVHGNTPTPIVFSMSEYHAAAQAHGVWHKVLAGALSGEPVVVVGAKILDDLDIETLILNAIPKADAPSIIVDPFISNDNAWELENAGFVIFRDLASNWTHEWVETFGLSGPQLAQVYESRSINIPQIKELEARFAPPPPSSHDILGGSEPLWSDATNGYIAEFGWMQSTFAQIVTWSEASSPGVRIQVLYVPRLAGATAGLFRVAYEASKSGIRVLQFDKSARFDTQRLLDVCAASGPTLVVVDGGHSFIDDFDDLASKAVDINNISLYILLVDRPNNASMIEDRLTTHSYKIEVGSVALRRNKADSHAMVSLLEYQGRLGLLESAPTSARVRHFQGQDIFSAQSEVEHGSGFRARVDQEIRLLTTKWHRDLVILLTLASDGGVQVSLTEAAFALDTTAASIITALDDSDQLGALVEFNGDLLSARHRLRSVDSLLSEKAGAAFLSHLSLMLKRLSNLVSKSGRSRSRSSALVSHLMSAKMLHSVFPNISAASLYQELLSSYGDWNARYWEQRSIYARLTRDWDRAVSFAERAVSVWDDSYTRNTLGVNLLAKSTNMAHRGDPAWRTYYGLGQTEFDQALDRERSTTVARWARLTSTLELIAALATRAEESKLRESAEEVLDDWSSAYAEYRVTLPVITGSESVSEAERLADRFDSLADKIRAQSPIGIQLKQRKAELRATIKSAFSDLQGTATLAKLTAEVISKLDSDPRPDWAGHGTFRRALQDALPHVHVDSDHSATIYSGPEGAPGSIPPVLSKDEVNAKIAEAIRRVCNELTKPTPLGEVANRVNAQLDLDGKHGWGKHLNFKSALLAARPECRIVVGETGAVVHPS